MFIFFKNFLYSGGKSVVFGGTGITANVAHVAIIVGRFVRMGLRAGGRREPSTADLIAQQSQDYVDERLQEFQATIVQLQSECLFFLLFIIDGSLFLKISKHTDTAAGVGGESDRESASGSVKVVLSRKQSHKNLAHVQ